MMSVHASRLKALGIEFTTDVLGTAWICHPYFPGWRVAIRSDEDVRDLLLDLADDSEPAAAIELETLRDTKRRQREQRKTRQQEAA